MVGSAFFMTTSFPCLSTIKLFVTQKEKLKLCLIILIFRSVLVNQFKVRLKRFFSDSELRLCLVGGRRSDLEQRGLWEEPGGRELDGLPVWSSHQLCHHVRGGGPSPSSAGAPLSHSALSLSSRTSPHSGRLSLHQVELHLSLTNLGLWITGKTRGIPSPSLLRTTETGPYLLLRCHFSVSQDWRVRFPNYHVRYSLWWYITSIWYFSHGPVKFCEVSIIII